MADHNNGIVSFATGASWPLHLVLLLQVFGRGLACMCLPEHPQQQFCRADFGKYNDVTFIGQKVKMRIQFIGLLNPNSQKPQCPVTIVVRLGKWLLFVMIQLWLFGLLQNQIPLANASSIHAFQKICWQYQHSRFFGQFLLDRYNNQNFSAPSWLKHPPSSTHRQQSQRGWGMHHCPTSKYFDLHVCHVCFFCRQFQHQNHTFLCISSIYTSSTKTAKSVAHSLCALSPSPSRNVNKKSMLYYTHLMLGFSA